MRVVATIEDPVVIRKILTHLGLPTDVPAPRPRRPTIGVTGRIVHDLRRSGVKHLIETPGNDPHTVMAFSGHSTPSMLRRYHIIDLDVMRQAAERASARRSDSGTVTPLRDRPTSALPRQEPDPWSSPKYRE
jgi:hypothetical protein